MADADRLLAMARRALEGCATGGAEHRRLTEAAELLGQPPQGIERTAPGASIKEGTARDRMLLVHDPQMGYGHKSKRFEGHKAALAVDTESGLITAGAVGRTITRVQTVEDSQQPRSIAQNYARTRQPSPNLRQSSRTGPDG